MTIFKCTSDERGNHRRCHDGCYEYGTCMARQASIGLLVLVVTIALATTPVWWPQ